jgi:hypothetical protein
MTEISLPIPQGRPADQLRRLVRACAIPALIAALAFSISYFTAEKACRGGAFSAAFGSGFDVKRCDLVVRTNGGDAVIRVRLPQ